MASAALQQIIRLFRSLKRPSTRSVQGLWAELFVIRMAHDARAMVLAWRADPFERFDFAAKAERLEVKSTKWTRRSHQFSLEQLQAAGDIRVIVASVQVASLANGLTLARLWHDVRLLVEDNAKLLLHVDQVVTTSLGRAWRRGLKFGFDDNVARNTLAFYDAKLIPAVDGTLPTEVSEVRFRSDLSAMTPLSPDAMRSLGCLFQAAKADPV
ncbi:MAG TPA: PD-(D/E)XK motif protein [Tepidisphaeraceae bacterium]|nr:PD-(D/E)XK motif protein [Tepidisphaeraceae bacterium]